MQTVKTRRGLANVKNRAKWLATCERNINSSEIGALFGLSPYMTPLELYALKKGLIGDSFQDNDRAAAGRFLEAGIAAWAQEKFGFKAKPLKDYLEIPAEKTGASFDWQLTEWSEAPVDFAGFRVPVDVKMVGFLGFNGTFKNGYADRKWNADNPDDIVAPANIELQVQHQLLMTGAPFALIIVVVAGNSIHRIVRMRNETIIGKIRARVAQFWADVEAGNEPTADYERDAETIKRLYTRPDPRAAIAPDQHARLMAAIERATAAAADKKAAASVEEIAKAEVMDVLRDVELAILPNGSKVSWKADKNGRRALRLTAAAAFAEAA